MREAHPGVTWLMMPVEHLRLVRDEDAPETMWEQMLRLDVELPPRPRVALLDEGEIIVERARERPGEKRWSWVPPPPRIAKVGDSEISVVPGPTQVLRVPIGQIPFAIDRSGRLAVKGARPRSIGNDRLTRRERAELKMITRSLKRAGHYEDRPKAWGDCEKVTGPCPWISCSMNLYIDVIPVAGRPNSPPIVKYNFPGREIDQLKETCALRVALRGSTVEPTQGAGMTLEEVGELVNLTSQRVDQLIQTAQKQMKPRLLKLMRQGEEEEDAEIGE